MRSSAKEGGGCGRLGRRGYSKVTKEIEGNTEGSLNKQDSVCGRM